MQSVNKRLDDLEAVTRATQEQRIRRDYDIAVESFTDDDLIAIENETASSDLLLRFYEYTQMPKPPEVVEVWNRLLKVYDTNPEKFKEDRVSQVIQKAAKRRDACRRVKQ